jgi:hypothetical protein
MHSKTLITAVFLVMTVRLSARTPAGFTGHWKGAVRSPGQQFPFEIDIPPGDANTAGGTLHSSGSSFPMKIEVNERAIKFYGRTDQAFTGELAMDGQSIAGEVSLSGYLLPFELTRTGDAVPQARLESPSIPGALEGRWDGLIELGGRHLRFQLKLRNERDGKAAGEWISLDEGNMEVPVAITTNDTAVTFELRGLAAMFQGNFDSKAKTISGTYHEGGISVPVVFRLAEPHNP